MIFCCVPDVIKKLLNAFLKKCRRFRIVLPAPPHVLSVDRKPAYPPAVKDLKKEKLLDKDCILRQNKYLNNIIEQDHRFIKRRVNAGMGFRTFHSAWRTHPLKGCEIMNMIRKGQVKNIEKENIVKTKTVH